MSNIETVIEKFGGLSQMARSLGHQNPTTVQGWKERGVIPARQQARVLAMAREHGIALNAYELIPEIAQ